MKTYKTVNYWELPADVSEDFGEALEDSMGHYKYFIWNVGSTHLHGGDHDAFAVKMDAHLMSIGAQEDEQVIILIDW